MSCFLVLLTSAWALTLDEAVSRAGEVDPNALVAALAAERVRADSAGALFAIGPTPSVSVSRSWRLGAVTGTAPVDAGTLSVNVPLLSPPVWLNAAGMVEAARAEGHVATATRLDAQYAAAALVYEALATDADLRLGREGEAAAAATLEIVRNRVRAGLESELAERSAQVGLLVAQSAVNTADSDRQIAYARLARALEMPVTSVEPADPPALPDTAGSSPWLAAEAARWSAAKWERGERLAELFPTGGVSLSTNVLGARTGWALGVTGTWTFDGLAGPFLRFHQAGLDERIARIVYDALNRDLALGLDTAKAAAQAADRNAEVANARETLAAESLAIGQKRLESGLATSLEVLRLQDDLTLARADRVRTELQRALARLEARRVAGLDW